MKSIAARIIKFLKDEDAAEVLEWALLGCILLLGAIAAVIKINGWLKGRWNSVESAQP
jgi:Flp pilus assembly pilin Flp